MPHYNGRFFDHYLLRATERLDLNDPFEFLPPIQFYEGLVEDYKDKDPEWANNLTYEEFSKSFYLFHGVISFTETRSNLLMWSHYAEKHTGLVIEFDTENSFFEDAKRIRYNNIKPPQINVNDVEELFFVKSDEWIYEKEFRIVKNLIKHDYCIKKNDKDFTPTKESITVWGEECVEMHMFKVPKESIKSITFGVNIDNNVRNNIINKVRQDSNLLNVEFWDTKLSSKYFHLDFIKEENI